MRPKNPPTSGLLWRHSERGTEVLRTSFREGRLTSVEYEVFGEEYRRLVKDGRPVPVDRGELTRPWQQSARVEQAAEDCQAALDAFHRLVVQLQEITTSVLQFDRDGYRLNLLDTPRHQDSARTRIAPWRASPAR